MNDRRNIGLHFFLLLLNTESRLIFSYCEILVCLFKELYVLFCMIVCCYQLKMNIQSFRWTLFLSHIQNLKIIKFTLFVVFHVIVHSCYTSLIINQFLINFFFHFFWNYFLCHLIVFQSILQTIFTFVITSNDAIHVCFVRLLILLIRIKVNKFVKNVVWLIRFIYLRQTECQLKK